MIRKQLESKGFNLNDSEFAVVMEIVTDDIKFNRTGFGKRTPANEVIAIAARTVNVLRRCS